MNRHNDIKVIISGGGTGGHVFPAIAIANALKRMVPHAAILFVGALGRMEMERVPAAGYEIKGLPVAGFNRREPWKNIGVAAKLIRSIRMAGRIISDFNPSVVAGVGGYASGPVMWVARRRGIPFVIQEQNSYAGLTNRLVAKGASSVCVAWDDMERYFPAQSIVKTGNPVRNLFSGGERLREEALTHFGIDGTSPVVLLLGGSLGAASLNSVAELKSDGLRESGVTWIWQSGRRYYDRVRSAVGRAKAKNVVVKDFIERMDLAYAVADIIVSRAGAGTISELTLAGKPVVLVPSPNVVADHQTRNAEYLQERDAALLLPDGMVAEGLISSVVSLVNDEGLRERLAANISRMAITGSDEMIAKEILKYAGYGG